MEQGGNYTLCLQLRVPAPFCGISKMTHAVHNAFIYEVNALEYTTSVSSALQRASQPDFVTQSGGWSVAAGGSRSSEGSPQAEGFVG